MRIRVPVCAVYVLSIVLWFACGADAATGNPVVLNNMAARQPKINRCVIPDIPGYPTPVFTQCPVRSNGCNFALEQCILTTFIGYQNNTEFLFVTRVVYGAEMPGVSDGRVKAELRFTNTSLLQLQGFVQLWVLSKTIEGQDLYEFTNYESYLDGTTLDPYTGLQYVVWFNGLPAGRYLIAYWDTGGTRFGSGVPEMSSPFFIRNVFPLDISPCLRLQAMPEARLSYTVDGAWVYPDTYMSVGINQYISYMLTATPCVSDELLAQYIEIANQSMNRPLVWEERSDQGNVINAKTYTNYFAGGVNMDTMMKYKFFPKMSGLYYYATGAQGTSNGRRTVLYARLMYTNVVPFRFLDYWSIGSGYLSGRQNYGIGTTVAYKVLLNAAVEYDQYPNTAPDPKGGLSPFGGGTGADSGTPFTVRNNIVSFDGTHDVFNAYYAKNAQYCLTSQFLPNNFDKLNCASVQLMGMSGANQWLEKGSGTGELGVFEDFYQIDDVYTGGPDYLPPPFTPQRPHEHHGFRLEPSFIDHDNTNPDFDGYCAPTGTNYAQAKDRVGGYAWHSYTFADVFLQMNRAYAFYGVDVCYAAILGCEGIPEARGPCGCYNMTYLWLNEFVDPEVGCDFCGDATANVAIYAGVSPDGPPNMMATAVMARANFWADEIDLNYQCWNTTTTVQEICVKDTAVGPRPVGYLPAVNDPAYSPAHANHANYPYLQQSFDYLNRDFIFPQNGLFGPFFLVPPSTCIYSAYGTCNLGSGGFSSHPISGNVPFLVNGYEDTSVQLGNPLLMVRRQGTYGYDTQTITSSWVDDAQMDGYFQMWLTLSVVSYARFKVWQSLEFYYFQNARLAFDTYPDSIEIAFGISCPLVATGYSTSQGYCAETCTLTNQFNQAIIIAYLSGPAQTLSTPSYAPWDSSQTLGPTVTQADYLLMIQYNDGDILQLVCLPRAEPEKPMGVAFCNLTSPTQIPVPPKTYVFQPLVTYVATIQPVCAFDSVEIGGRYSGGQPFIYQSDLSNPLTNDILYPPPVDGSTVVNYYSTITTGSSGTFKGFNAQDQLYDPPMSYTVCDTVSCVVVGNSEIVIAPVLPLNPDPLFRPPGCADTSQYGTCSVNSADNPIYSGIDTFPTCAVAPTGPATVSYTNEQLCRPRLRFLPGYSWENIGMIAFAPFEQFVDPLKVLEETTGIFQQQTNYIVTQNIPIIMTLRYQTSIASLLADPPCVETFDAQIIILSSWVLNPTPVVRIPSCTRPDQCCYAVPFKVFGNNPYTGATVDMDDNVTNSCYRQPACTYEIIVTPPANSDGGLCLGYTYTFTAQSPAALVAARTLPAYVNSTTSVPAVPYHFAYRCPATVVLTLPVSGFGQITIITTPGDCVHPGTNVQFITQISNVLCTGPVTVATQTTADCQYNLYFAIAPLNGVPFPGSPTLASPQLIAGAQAFTYNADSSFFLDDVPTGYWQAYLWMAAPSGSQAYSSVADQQNTATIQFVATLGGTVPLHIFLVGNARPVCAGPNIVLTYQFIDETGFRGPYLFTFTDPVGRLISTQTVDALAYCNGEPTTACDLEMQSNGIPFVGLIQTGNKTVGYSGLFTLTVVALPTSCAIAFSEDVLELDTLTVQVQCNPTSCYGTRDGSVLSSVSGGTPIITQNLTIVTGAGAAVYLPTYTYVWHTPESPLAINTPEIQFATAGWYNVTVTDSTGQCSVYAACLVTSPPPIVLAPVSSVAPNCSNAASVGSITWRVANATQPVTLFQTNQVGVTSSGPTVTTSTVVPGVNTTYFVVDGAGCMSPYVSFTLQGPVDFTLSVQTVKYPCAANQPTGTMSAAVPTQNIGTTFSWYLTGDNTLQGTGGVLSNAVAASYTVVAQSSLYGCTATAVYTLTVRDPPQITILRTVDEFSVFVQSAVGSVVSANGPPYAVDFYGINVNTGYANSTTYRQVSLAGSVMTYEMTLIGTTETFIIIATDSGGCVSTLTTLGTPITDNLIVPSNSRLKNFTRAEAAKARKDVRNEFLYLWSIVLVAVVCIGALYALARFL
jgi:hypothetical protein